MSPSVRTLERLVHATGNRLRLTVVPAGAVSDLSYSNWHRRVWEPAWHSAHLAYLKFQALRTLNTTAMVALAVDVKTAQTRAGHSRPRPRWTSTRRPRPRAIATLPPNSATTSSPPRLSIPACDGGRSCVRWMCNGNGHSGGCL